MCSFAQLRLTLCDTIDCSPPGFSVHGILQARILEWIAISLSTRRRYIQILTHNICECDLIGK